MLEKGLVQIYTGQGKGKTTAAFGLAMRAAGHGCKVLIYQFLKPASLDLGERASAKKLGVTVEALDHAWNMRNSFDDAEAVSGVHAAIGEAMAEITAAAVEKRYDVIVLDEIVFCVKHGLAEIGDIKKLIASKHERTEIVMTGRDATDELIEMADLVTEMKQIKHPYEKGIHARKAIEY